MIHTDQVAPPRPPEELQKAHDTLIAIIRGDVPRVALSFGEEPLEKLKRAADVLCWALGHNDPRVGFEAELATIDAALEAVGWKMVDSGVLSYHKPPGQSDAQS